MKHNRLYAGLALSCAFVISVYAQPSQYCSAARNGILERNLRRAAKTGDVAWVQRALTRGACIDARDSDDGVTALHIAVHQGHEAATQLLLQAGAPIEMSAKHGVRPLYLAAQKGHATIVQLLLSAGACVDSTTSPDQSVRTALHKAAKEGHKAVVRVLLDAGANTDQEDYGGCSPLHLAASRGHGAVIQMLLEAGATVDAKDKKGCTPLHWAVIRGRVSVFHTLICAGANVDFTTDAGVKALLHAVRRDKKAAILKLFSCGAVPLTASSREDRRKLMRLSQQASLERKQAILTALNNTAIQAGSSEAVGLPRELRNLISSMSEHADVVSLWQHIDSQWREDSHMLE